MYNKDLRNCRCCMTSYSKPEGYWCEFSLRDKETQEIVTPIGFCEFCDKNSKSYSHFADCHASLFLRLIKKAPYWVRRFVERTDGYNMSNWQYIQFAVFKRWTVIKYNPFKHYGLDVERFEQETGISAHTFKSYESY